jgi:ethanolamine utilization microcompartment shell protein EutS
MLYRLIKTPSKGTLGILTSRQGAGRDAMPADIGAVGLVQGAMIDMLVAADVAEKADGVTAVDIKGSCPQNMILLAIFGDTASVEDALDKIKDALGKQPAR